MAWIAPCSHVINSIFWILLCWKCQEWHGQSVSNDSNVVFVLRGSFLIILRSFSASFPRLFEPSLLLECKFREIRDFNLANVSFSGLLCLFRTCRAWRIFHANSCSPGSCSDLVETLFESAQSQPFPIIPRWDMLILKFHISLFSQTIFVSLFCRSSESVTQNGARIARSGPGNGGKMIEIAIFFRCSREGRKSRGFLGLLVTLPLAAFSRKKCPQFWLVPARAVNQSRNWKCHHGYK